MKVCRPGLACLALLCLLGISSVQAQDEGYDLSWWTVDGGGAFTPFSAGYSLGGTAGQPDAVVWVVGGGAPIPYSLSGGFWFTGPAVSGYEVFLPVIVRGGP